MFYDRFIELCQKNNAKPTPVVKSLGLSSGVVAKWRSGAIPNGETLSKLSEYFNVSVDFLLQNEDLPLPKEKDPSKDIEKSQEYVELEKILNNLDVEQLQVLLATAKALNKKRGI